MWFGCGKHSGLTAESVYGAYNDRCPPQAILFARLSVISRYIPWHQGALVGRVVRARRSRTHGPRFEPRDAESASRE